ncbi:MAG: RidA family protein [SAR202 cluster bacterium]|nr:RidA family protein [SAR202 cluster bacterium]
MDIIRHDHPNIYAGGPNYSRSVRAGNLLFVSGCTANKSPAKGGDPLDQLRVVLGRITGIVEAEGGKASDIVKLTTFVADKKYWFPIKDGQIEIYDEFFSGENPANTIVEAGIGGEGLDIEIDAVAVLH